MMGKHSLITSYVIAIAKKYDDEILEVQVDLVVHDDLQDDLQDEDDDEDQSDLVEVDDDLQELLLCVPT